MYHAAYRAYMTVKTNLTTALQGERDRQAHLERQMRAAGLTVTEPGPLARWSTAWVDSGICSIYQANRVTQNTLRDGPLLGAVHGISAARLAPRPDRAPPASPPAAAIQLYVAMTRSPNTTTWSAVAVQGGDGLTDDHAALVFEAAGPTDRTTGNWGCDLTAAIGRALQAAQAAAPMAPVVLRADGPIARTAAGLGDCSERDYRRLQQILTHLYVAGSECDAGLPWADRALALARLCLPTNGAPRTWGVAGQTWPALPQAAPPAQTTCPVCLEDLTDPLPTAQWTSQAPVGLGGPTYLYACSHAVCRRCDLRLQHPVQLAPGGPLTVQSCPLCRSPRARRTRTQP